MRGRRAWSTAPSEVHKGVLARYLMDEREGFWQWDRT
jgi:hypothetical protein